MKKAIISFKQKSKSLIGCAGVYYKEIPKILTRYYFRRLAKKGCWDIEIINPDEFLEEFKTRSYSSKDYELFEKWSDNPYNHIPRID